MITVEIAYYMSLCIVPYVYIVEEIKMGEIFQISGGIGELKHNNNNMCIL